MFNKVKEYRQQKGWTQFRLAINANVNPSDISKIENGILRAGIAVKNRLALALEIDVEILFPEN